MKKPAPIIVVDRFPELRTRLLDLLAGLSDEDWNRQTVAPQWSVKDIAAHLLQGDIGELSRWRDGFRPGEKPIPQYGDLVELVNGLNDQWVRAARRISPRLLREFLAFTGAQVEASGSIRNGRAGELGGSRCGARVVRSGASIYGAVASPATDSRCYGSRATLRTVFPGTGAGYVCSGAASFVPVHRGGRWDGFEDRDFGRGRGLLVPAPRPGGMGALSRQ